MRLRLTFQLTGSAPDVELFSGIPRGRPIWGTFFASICGHAAVAWLAFSYIQFLKTASPDIPHPRPKARVLDISFRLYDPPRWRPEAAKPAPGDPSEPRLAKLRAPSAPRTSSGDTPESRANEVLRRFRLPPLPQTSKVAETLVQLDLPPTADLQQELRVPALILLSEKNQRVPPKPFVAPPERKRDLEVASPVVLEAQAPVLEAHAGHAKMPEILTHTPPPVPTPAGAVSPIAASHQTTPSRQTATLTAQTAGDEVNIVSLPNRPIPAASSIVLPAVNQVAARDLRNGGRGSETADGASGNRGPSAGAGGTGNPGNQSGAGNEKRLGNSQAHGSNGDGLTINAGLNSTGALGAGMGNQGAADSESGSGALTGTARSRSIPPPAVTGARVVHPKDGHYEIAVVQSTGVVPGSAGLLEGRPVYSVYVSVAARKEWILQYCARSSGARSQPSQVVQLGPITAVSAPYAHTIIRPEVQFRSAARYGFVHGFVNLSGRFEQLREAGEPAIENIGPVLESLQMWEFRPAARDGVATAVEVLLCIPNAGL